MRPDDRDDLLVVFGDPRVMAAFGVKPFGQSEMKQWVERNLEHQNRYGYGLFSIIHKADRCLVGDCGLEHREIGGFPKSNSATISAAIIGIGGWRPRPLRPFWSGRSDHCGWLGCPV
jgi:RimJ/RimL family protein N-acetyltransferase